MIDKVGIDEELSVGSDEVRPTERMPIIRRDAEGQLLAELRHWGFLMEVASKTLDKATGKPKKVRKSVINAMSEKLTTSYMWKWPFKERRCLIPMTSWDEWPELTGVKQRVSISKPDELVFAAAGLYDVNTDPKTGERVAVYTMCTVPPTVLLGTVHDRAPMVLRPHEYEAWLDGGPAAEALLGRAPASEEFTIVPVGPPTGGQTRR